MKATATHQRLRMLAHVMASSGQGEQADVFGGVTMSDQRRALEAIAQAPNTSTRHQNAPGAAGGLFDHAHKQSELF